VGNKSTGTSTTAISLLFLVVTMFSLPCSPSKRFSSLHLTSMHAYLSSLRPEKQSLSPSSPWEFRHLKEMNEADKEWLLCVFKETTQRSKVKKEVNSQLKDWEEDEYRAN